MEAGTPGRLKVTAKSTESEEIVEGEYNTVRTDQPRRIFSPCRLICHFHAALTLEQLFLRVYGKKQNGITVITMGKMLF